MINTTSISICIIAKNEESCIERCLKSIKPLNAEIVVVDTGSTDTTKDIASRYTSSVYDFKWIDDFSAARNYSIQKANNDWILIMDCDEWITDFDQTSILSFMSEHSDKIGLVNHNNIMDADNPNDLYNISLERFFNRNYYHYIGNIHEQIKPIKNSEYKTFPISITVYHDGYCTAQVNSQDKFKRNVSLLKKQLTNNPSDPYLLFQIGQSYFQAKQYEQAINYYEKALSQSLNYKSTATQMLVYSWINCLNELHRSDEALSILPYYEDLCQYADFPLLMGHVYTNLGQYIQAMSEYLKAMTISQYHQAGANSFLPLYHIGNINHALGNVEMAQTMYIKCGDYAPALQALKKLQEL